MGLSRQSAPSLYGGISQQAASLRSLNQVEDAANCTFSVREGISKRNPLMLTSVLTSREIGLEAAIPFEDWFLHDVSHPNGEVYIVAIPGDGTYLVYRERDGALMPISNTDPEPYLTVDSGDTARLAYRAISVGEKVYIVNTRTRVLMTEDLSTGTISGTAQTLQDAGLDTAPDGAIYRIVGSSGTDYDTHYARKSGGKWFEWVEPGIPIAINAATMPHTIVIQEAEANPLDVVCTFSSVAWAERGVGDAKTNKEPSFVGRRISGTFLQFDRLCFLAASSVICSETGEHANFWRTTVTDVLDTDRIDVTVTGAGNSTLYWGKPLARSVILFAGSRQFSMDGNPIFSPRTATVSEATAFSSSRTCEPVNLGANLYFATDSSSSAQVMEMFVQEDVVAKDAANVTSHVPSLIPRGIEQLVTNPNFDTVIASVYGSPVLYAYEFMWSGDQKVQSAWSRWTLTGAVTAVIHMYSRDEYIYLVCRASHSSAEDDPTEQLVLLRLNLNRRSSVWQTLSSSGEPACLDLLHRVEPEYNGVENRTYYQLRYPLRGRPSGRCLFIGGPRGGTYQRLALDAPEPVFWVDADRFYLVGQQSAALVVGQTYNQTWRLSEQFFFEGDRPNLIARVQLRNATIRFSATASFSVSVQVKGSDPATQNVIPALLSTYSGRTTGNEDLSLGTATRIDGSFTFPVLGRTSDVTITFSNFEPTPANFSSLEWEALVSSRSRR